MSIAALLAQRAELQAAELPLRERLQRCEEAIVASDRAQQERVASFHAGAPRLASPAGRGGRLQLSAVGSDTAARTAARSRGLSATHMLSRLYKLSPQRHRAESPKLRLSQRARALDQ